MNKGRRDEQRKNALRKEEWRLEGRKNERKDERKDEWMKEEWMKEWKEGWKEGWMNEGRMNEEWKEGWKEGWVKEGWMNDWRMNGRMLKWMRICIKSTLHFKLDFAVQCSKHFSSGQSNLKLIINGGNPDIHSSNMYLHPYSWNNIIQNLDK